MLLVHFGCSAEFLCGVKTYLPCYVLFFVCPYYFRVYFMSVCVFEERDVIFFNARNVILIEIKKQSPLNGDSNCIKLCQEQVLQYQDELVSRRYHNITINMNQEKETLKDETCIKVQKAQHLTTNRRLIITLALVDLMLNVHFRGLRTILYSLSPCGDKTYLTHYILFCSSSI